MEKTNQIAAVACIACILLLSGCVEVQVQQTFSPNGLSHIVQQVEISGLIEVLNTSGISYESLSGYGAWDSVFTESCRHVPSFERYATCHRVGNWLVIDQERVSGEDYIFTTYDQFPYKIYELTILRPPRLPSSPASNETLLGNITISSFTNVSRQTLSVITSTGVKYAYRVEMPGEIFNTSAGKIVGTAAEFDVISQAKGGSPVVMKSRVPNYEQITIAAVFGLDILLFIDVAILYVLNWAKSNKEKIERIRAEARERAELARQASRRTKLKGYDVYSFEGGDSISKLNPEGSQSKGKAADSSGKKGNQKGK